ncbi:MAG TPA: tetratricopeptide repeat protein [Gemmatimonadales bacterium]|jgi:tetratricopeptide (TPR) repeat protein|nr:tetratricopeptide repeat protein [Gemmatimonadales bacterium]
MSKLEQLKEKAKGLEAKDPKRAVEIWLEVLNAQESDGEANPDLSIYNRIGDLYIKLKDPGLAADYYDQAVDKYAELGFHNNAIAMCNKVLRNAPARQTTYLKLAKLYAAKGFMAEAKQNFVEYAERMQKVGKIEHAFAALKEFTDISAEGAGLREMLSEHLKLYGTDPGKRGSAPRMSTPSAAKTAPPAEKDDLSRSGKRKTSSLVFLDLDEPRVAKSTKGPLPGVAPAKAPPPVVPEPDESLQIETTSLVDEAPGGVSSGGMLEGLETTVTDFGQVRASSPKTPSIREELNPADLDLPPMAELEPTVPEVSADEVPGLDDADLVLEGNIDVKPPPRKAPAKKAAPPPPAPAAPKLKPLGGKSAAPEPPRVKPVVPKRPSAPTATPPSGPGKRKTVVEVPPLELEPDFETATTDAGHDVDDEPLAIDEPRSHPSFIQTEDVTSIAPGQRRSGFIDLGIDEINTAGDQAGSLVFSNIEETPAAPRIEELESRVADNPDDPEAHQALGEALVEQGDRERGIEELDLATGGFENAGNLRQARDLVDEVLHLDPNSVRHRQKAVEFAFKAGDKAKLIDAYLELADALLRSDLPDKARAVYARVADHDPKNERAKGALSMLAPAVAPSGKPEGKVKAKDAKMKVRDEAALDGDFVDLGSMLSDDEDDGPPAKDTRMTVADEEPTGDEEQDFQDMLARFKQGIDENIDDTDFQSHYDLGVAFKEMGLLDEAIAELQKALHAPEGKLRTSEMLGICFFEKGAFGVAESILRRGLDLPASGDQERLGVLYWLGRALEQQGKKADARDLYGRVFAVDIRFLDAEQRVKALAKAK